MTKRKQNTKKTTARTTKAASAKADSFKKRLLIGVGLLVIILGTIASMSAFAKYRTVAEQNQKRLDQIVAVYNSLDLGDDYKVKSSDVFGDKRVYDWDSGRSKSSAVTYVHADTTQNTLAKLDEKIKAAGFIYIDEPYPGDPTRTQYHYKSEAGVYIRLTVYSKVYNDAYESALALKTDNISKFLKDVSFDAAPSEAIIKVNLDDNNE